MIRQATHADIGDIHSVLRDFARIVLDEDISITEYGSTLENLITDHVVLVSDTDEGITGVILGQFIKHPFWKKQVLQEVAWYATDNTGGRLLRAFVHAGKAAKVDGIYLTILDSAGVSVHKAVQRIGFEAVERSYIMKL